VNGEIANVDIDIIRINTAVSDLHDELRQLQDQYNSAQSNRKGNITRQINAWHRDHAARLQKLEEERKTQFSRRDDLHNQADRIAEKVATVATQIDIFASGAGGALNNNLGFRDFVRPTHMSDYNYTFEFSHSSPPPSPSATLRCDIEQHRGDSFTSREQIDVVASEPDGTVVDTADLSVGNQPTHAGRDEQLVIHQPDSNRVRITLPWHHARVSDNAVYARTIYLYWDQGTLAHADVRIFRVTIEKVRILDSRDVGDGEYRIFVEVGGYWLFVNEFVSDDNILEDGLGDTGGGDDSDYDWQINQVSPWFSVQATHSGCMRMAGRRMDLATSSDS